MNETEFLNQIENLTKNNEIIWDILLHRIQKRDMATYIFNAETKDTELSLSGTYSKTQGVYILNIRHKDKKETIYGDQLKNLFDLVCSLNKEEEKDDGNIFLNIVDSFKSQTS